MNRTFSLKYGEKEIEIPIMGARSIEVLQGNPMKEIEDVPAAFYKAVEQEPIDSPPLSQLIQPNDLVTLVVSDITRAWTHQDQVIGPLVSFLHETCQVPYEHMVILIALGTHRPNTEEEMKQIVSPAVYEKVQVLNHNCDAPDLVYVGTTSRGTRVEVNPLVVGRKVILVGGTVHHLMAGFGGGRKSILPGVCSRRSIRENHERALSPTEKKTDDKVGSGKLSLNPIHEDMDEAAALVAPVFGINLVMASSGKHSGLFCGNWRTAGEASCRYQKQCYEVPVDHLADVVIVSCGGYPKDINLYQAIKCPLNAINAMKPGGTLLFLAECRDGGGAKDYFDWVRPLKEGRLDEALRADFTIGGYIFYATCEWLRRGKIFLMSQLPPELVKEMNITSAPQIETLLKQIDFTGKDVYVVPYGGYILPVPPVSK